MFDPQIYTLPDSKFENFIDAEEIRGILNEKSVPTKEEVLQAISLATDGTRLSMEQTAVLLNAGAEFDSLILDAARKVKEKIYGRRLVIFAPLYIGNRCVNNCLYCGFRAANSDAVRRTLSDEELISEVVELERTGQKRLILVWGEHPVYDAARIARDVRTVYGVSQGNGRINRVNINSAPMEISDYRIIKDAGIGTYQVFQETYDPELYVKYHPSGPKKDYVYRLTAPDRAMEAGIDDIGLGVLFGLGDPKFETLALVRHTNHLEACFGVGPHTISFPRIKSALNRSDAVNPGITDEEFTKVVAVLRLAVPYAGLILTAREPAALRDRLLEYGISQIDAGSNIDLGGYHERHNGDPNRGQFQLNDRRTLAAMIESAVDAGHIPSFCTACYRKGRTGEHFMSFSVNGKIKDFCTPNGILTFGEYLEDYADPQLLKKGYDLIAKIISEISNDAIRETTIKNLARIKAGERDIFL